MLGASIFLALAGAAGAEKPAIVDAGNLELPLNGGVPPKVLSRKVPTPVALRISAHVATLDGGHPRR